MSEWIQPPTQLGAEYNKNDIKPRQSRVAKLGKKVADLVGYKAETLATSQDVYSYFARISNNNEAQFAALVNEFNKAYDNNGFNFAVQQVIDSILSGVLPRPKGLANSFAYASNADYFESDNGYKEIIAAQDRDFLTNNDLVKPAE